MDNLFFWDYIDMKVFEELILNSNSSFLFLGGIHSKQF